MVDVISIIFKLPQEKAAVKKGRISTTGGYPSLKLKSMYYPAFVAKPVGQSDFLKNISPLIVSRSTFLPPPLYSDDISLPPLCPFGLPMARLV